MTCLLGRQTFFILVPCAIMKSEEGLFIPWWYFHHLVFCFHLLSFQKWYLQSCVGLVLVSIGFSKSIFDLDLWYNLDLPWFLDILSKLYLPLVIEGHRHAYLLHVYWRQARMVDEILSTTSTQCHLGNKYSPSCILF